MSGYAELVAATNFSFLRGASHGSDLVGQAIALGLAGIGIADRNTVAGVVRAHVALRDAKAKLHAEEGLELDFRLVVGARLVFADGTPDIIAYPETRHGWGRLCRLLTTGNLRAEKGDCILRLEDLLEYIEDLLLIVMPGNSLTPFGGEGKRAQRARERGESGKLCGMGRSCSFHVAPLSPTLSP
jgi:error-prone DNA polymerase